MQPAEVRELRLVEPDNEDWGLTILVSRAEPSAEQMTRLLQLAEDGPGGIAALVAGDPEAADGRMAPTVLQLAPDPGVPEGIVANVVPLQITVRPRALSAADYDAIGTLFAVAADLDDVGARRGALPRSTGHRHGFRRPPRASRGRTAAGLPDGRDRRQRRHDASDGPWRHGRVADRRRRAGQGSRGPGMRRLDSRGEQSIAWPGIAGRLAAAAGWPAGSTQPAVQRSR